MEVNTHVTRQLYTSGAILFSYDMAFAEEHATCTI